MAEKQEQVQEEVLQAKATLKYARISSRKVKIVADLIRGKNVDEALAIMKFTPKVSTEILEKLLKSAIANAENNHGMSHEKLYVSGISKIEIERTAKFVKVNVYTAKPGLVIGKGGNLAESLKEE